jgi:uncharacterized protein YndB with AHSA1/START domain
VWSAITDPAERASWMGETTIDARVGGHIEMMPSARRSHPTTSG